MRQRTNSAERQPAKMRALSHPEFNPEIGSRRLLLRHARHVEASGNAGIQFHREEWRDRTFGDESNFFKKWLQGSRSALLIWQEQSLYGFV